MMLNQINHGMTELTVAVYPKAGTILAYGRNPFITGKRCQITSKYIQLVIGNRMSDAFLLCK